jgi:hypothetical protein
MKKQSGTIIYSPSDLIRYLASPFASWLDRYYLENPGAITPDSETEEEKLFSRAGDEHEQSILSSYKASNSGVLEISKADFAAAHAATLTAIKDRAPVIYQAALQDGLFAGYADFLILDATGKYQEILGNLLQIFANPIDAGFQGNGHPWLFSPFDSPSLVNSA